MKRLIIHPRDRTTAFLKPIYEDLPGTTVIEGGVSKAQLRKLIDAHDQTIMMGHGTQSGLLAVGQFPQAYGHIIDDSFADQLAERDNNIFIWCHADSYTDWNELNGFRTGMFISEMGEARVCGLRGVYLNDLNESNDTFVQLVRENITSHPKAMSAVIEAKYGEIAEWNPIAQYNWERMGFTDEFDTTSRVRYNGHSFEETIGENDVYIQGSALENRARGSEVGDRWPSWAQVDSGLVDELPWDWAGTGRSQGAAFGAAPHEGHPGDWSDEILENAPRGFQGVW